MWYSVPHLGVLGAMRIEKTWSSSGTSNPHPSNQRSSAQSLTNASRFDPSSSSFPSYGRESTDVERINSLSFL